MWIFPPLSDNTYIFLFKRKHIQLYGWIKLFLLIKLPATLNGMIFKNRCRGFNNTILIFFAMVVYSKTIYEMYSEALA